MDPRLSMSTILANNLSATSELRVTLQASMDVWIIKVRVKTFLVWGCSK